MNKEFFSGKEIISSYSDLKNKIYVFARVNPEAFSSYRQDKKIGKWNPIPETGGRRYFVELQLDASEKILEDTIDDIHRLLNSYFLTDFQPRDLVDFKLVTDKKNWKARFPFIKVFGNSDFDILPNSGNITEEKIISSSRIMSMASLDSPVSNIQYSDQYPWNELENHYLFLKDNPEFLKRLVLIRESFMSLNSAFSTKGYFREAELLTGIIVLVSTLESLLVKGNKEEIKLRFSLIAAIFYEQNVKDDDFENGIQSKLKFNEVRDLFKTLYDIRSDLAHGTLNTFLKPANKHWQKLSEIFHVENKENASFSVRMKNYALIMNFMQYHIGILIKRSLNDFKKDSEDILKRLIVDNSTNKVN